jgi:hypothetical protein
MATYQDIRQQVETLNTSEQLQLLEELAAMVRHRASSTSGAPTVDSEPETAQNIKEVMGNSSSTPLTGLFEKEGIWVFETAPLDNIDFNALTAQSREERLRG